jgi:polyhydroxybutyrate depolymerase
MKFFQIPALRSTPARRVGALLALCASIVALSVCSAELLRSGSTGTDLTKPLSFDGRQRTYVLHIPASYRSGARIPLVIVFHGGGGNAENVAKMSGMKRKADEAGFLVVFPNGTGRFKKRLLTWNSGNCCGYALDNNVDDVGFVRAMIGAISTEYSVDSTRVFAAGISNGGMMCYRLACELSDKIAAIAPVAGALNYEPCTPKAPVSVVIFHGTSDEHVPFEGGKGAKNVDAHQRVDKSVAFAAAFWSHQDGCSVVPKTKQRGDVKEESYSGGRNGSEVVVYTIARGTHSWPGGKKGWILGDSPSNAISATDVMWDFFVNHPKR